jgi:hypothetical protein
MTSHTVDDVYAEVADIKKKLDQNGSGATKEYIDKKFKEAKEEPAQTENWAKAVGFGLDELVKSFKDFKGSSVVAWSALGAAITGFVVSNVIDSDSAKKAALKKIGFTHDDNGIPRRTKKLDARAAAAQPPPAPRAPVTSIDTERLKSMRKTSIDLARSLSDLTKDVNRAAQAIA